MTWLENVKNDCLKKEKAQSEGKLTEALIVMAACS